MKITVITIFPEFFESPLKVSILKRAEEKGIVEYEVLNLRDFATDKHRTTDDYQFGGGPGMVMKPEPIFRAIKHVREESPSAFVVMLTPEGRLFCQWVAEELSKKEHIVLLCGRYEGFDERVKKLVDDEISVGDYVLSGGEPAALVVIDAVVRLIPGVVGDPNSLKEESFSMGLLDYPHYTRPREFLGEKAPEILLSGNHGKIREWRMRQAVKRTIIRRPDIMLKALKKVEAKLYREALKELGEEGIHFPGPLPCDI